MTGKSIFIFDETGFSRICQAILAMEGFDVHIGADPSLFFQMLSAGAVGMTITSYPFGCAVLERLKGQDMPVIVLSDHINGELLKTLEALKNSCCLLKPLDYRTFRDLVKHFYRGPPPVPAGYRIM
ncbi:MAG: hypothetical protein M0Z58_10415 [Nitrospiraceae bacterium]|nr:hypothetical protein [Nitrospiraceae bacterium]